MNPTEILDFLLPHLGDPLQVFFLSIIVLMMGFTIVSAHRTARPAFWERKWNRGTPHDHTDDLDIDHGSVTDLWDAVATAPEKLVEVMPGMLLVVGLLGTFLGLGLALNHASHILGQANALSASGAANSMQDLLGLLQGLGTKFKTSTWGITGFVFLKIWSELTRFEEKRLTWVIDKVKAELVSRKQVQLAAEMANKDALFAQIGGVAEKIVQGLSEQIGLLMEREKVLHEHTLHYLTQGVKGVRKDLEQIHSETNAMNLALTLFTGSTQSVVENMAGAATRMAGGADKVGDAATGLVNAVQKFEHQFTDVLDNVRKDLGSAINDMSNQASQTLERGSVQLGDATREIATALGVLSDDVNATMNDVKASISDALQIQQRASNEFTLSSVALNDSITESTGMVEKLGLPIERGLRAVSESGQRMEGIGLTLQKVVVGLDKLPLVFESFGGLPAQQQSILQELRGLRLDLKPPTDTMEAVDPEDSAIRMPS